MRPPMRVAGGLHPSAQMVPAIRADSVLCVPTRATPIAQKRRPLSHRPRVWLTPPRGCGRRALPTPPWPTHRKPPSGAGEALDGESGPQETTRPVTLERDVEVPTNGATGKGRGKEGSFLCVRSHASTRSFLWPEAWRGAGHLGGLSGPVATARAQVGLEQVCRPGLSPTPRRSSTPTLCGHSAETPRGPVCPPAAPPLGTLTETGTSPG